MSETGHRTDSDVLQTLQPTEILQHNETLSKSQLPFSVYLQGLIIIAAVLWCCFYPHPLEWVWSCFQSPFSALEKGGLISFLGGGAFLLLLLWVVLLSLLSLVWVVLLSPFLLSFWPTRRGTTGVTTEDVARIFRA